MCGIAGLLLSQDLPRPALESRVRGMTALLRHRGPDGEGCWLDRRGAVALGHRRLAIVDLSETGHQPMVSATGRYAITFNGEIYNHRELRSVLQRGGVSFKGTSDTEVLLAGIEVWGLEATLRQCTGMFALALWDESARTLQLARDRIGEKPLYVWRGAVGLAFASEIRPLLFANGFNFEVNEHALGLLMRYGYVPDSTCIVSGVHKVSPGAIEVWKPGNGGPAQQSHLIRYWSISTERADPINDPQQATDRLHAEVKRAVADQQIADVPVGAFLSGGIDSTAVVAVAQQLSEHPVRTFCVSFDDPAYDEGPYARRVAEHLNTVHTEVRLATSDLVKIVGDLPQIYDEPFADSSQIPTIAVARAARQHVTVCLSGDGGDELFGGYNRYYWPARLGRWSKRWPRPLRRTGARTLRRLAGHTVGPSVAAPFRWFGRSQGPVQDIGGKILKAARVLEADDEFDAYFGLVTRWRDPSHVIRGWNGDDGGVDRLRRLMVDMDPFAAATLWDIEHYLPGDNLVKVDRASMSIGLEMRAPLLDHGIVELARVIVQSFSYRSFEAVPKWPLKRLVSMYVPDEMMRRPKMGFSVPLRRWLQDDLRDWSHAMCQVLSSVPFIQGDAVARLMSEHAKGLVDRSGELWPLLVFAQWLHHMQDIRASKLPSYGRSG